MDFEIIAAEVLRSLRGKRSQAAFSRKLGYRSNIVNRWEARKAFPSASAFLRVVGAGQRRQQRSVLLRFFPRPPAELLQILQQHDAGHTGVPTAELVGAFLRELQGKTPVVSVAKESGYNRYSVSRWLAGDVEPRLPQFLHLIEVLSRRLLDFVACCVDPAELPSLAADWRRLSLARQAAYDQPWSHAVLRALELQGSGARDQTAWLADRLGKSPRDLEAALALLEATGQVQRRGGRYKLRQVVSVNTSLDRERALGLKVNWTETALERMRQGAPGNYGYSVFAITKSDLRRLRDIHLEYVRAMQAVIATSKPGECVGLYCAQLLDLAQRENALEELER